MNNIPKKHRSTTAAVDLDPETGVPKPKSQPQSTVVSPRCSRLRADLLKKKWTKEDHRGGCQLPSCPPCGRHLRRQWVNTHIYKGQVIPSHLLAMVLEFPKLVLPVGSDRLGSYGLITTIADQRGVIEELGAAFQRSEFGEVAGWAYANHFSFHHPRRIGHHLHLGILCGRVPESEVLSKLTAFGKYSFKVKKSGRKDSHLEGFLAYLQHQPFPDTTESDAGFTDKARAWVEDVLVSPWQRAKLMEDVDLSLCVHDIDGPALSGNGFQCVEARARSAAVWDRLGLKQRLTDPDLRYRYHLLGDLTEVRHLVCCPICSTVQSGRWGPALSYTCTKSGCPGAWTDEAVFGHRRRGHVTRLLAAQEG